MRALLPWMGASRAIGDSYLEQFPSWHEIMQQGAVGGGPPVHVPKHRASLSSNVNALHLTARMGPAFARTEAAVYGMEEAAEVGMDSITLRHAWERGRGRTPPLPLAAAP